MSKTNVFGLPQHLRKDSKGYFLDYYLLKGGLKKRKRVRLGFIPLVQAKLVLAQHLQEMVTGKFLVEEKPKITFNEAADSFLAYSAARKKSYKNDAQITEKLKAFFKNRPLESLTPDHVEAFLNQRKKEGNKHHKKDFLKGSTLNRDMACLKTIIRRAILNKQIERNPIEGIRRFKEHSRDRTLTEQEWQDLLGFCPPHLKPIVELAKFSCMRRGEILGLKWDQVDFKNKIIVLEASDTKTDEKREIPLSSYLNRLFKGIPKTLGSPYVFTYRGKGIKNIRTSFQSVLRKAGIEDFHFHDFRHCAITNLRKAGVSDSVIMSISGHKTFSVFRKYDKIDREDRQDAFRRVEILNDTNKTRQENLIPQEVGL